MSSSKEEPRRPMCARCRHHGVLVPKKGHTRSCQFLLCKCWKCSLTTQRTHITALQRELMRDGQKREPRPRNSTRAEGAKGSASSATPERGARPSATSGPVSPPSRGAAESGAQQAGEQVAGSDSRGAPPIAYNSSYFGEYGQTAPLPFIHFPFRMPSYYPSGYSAPPDHLFNMPWFPPVPAGLYSDGLCGPMMFPHFQPGVVHQTPPPQPGADGRQVFIQHSVSLPETVQEELVSRQHLQPTLPKNTEHDSDVKDEGNNV